MRRFWAGPSVDWMVEFDSVEFAFIVCTGVAVVALVVGVGLFMMG